MLNEKEKMFVRIIEEAKLHATGQLEVALVKKTWTAMDYQEETGESVLIEEEGFKNRLATVKEVTDRNIDVKKCCDVCGVRMTV